ncbi:helix-turn-helix domain-containing protein [Nocardia brasiliensis]|uniref:helix-turn-helix domain-containing protein n=1 Tax=Nocardia brasiliensis TaxID=37326 RepID=UPI002454985A|nr:helix-turn-helix transcriptional regulator [Nocardia brasiliensis]
MLTEQRTVTLVQPSSGQGAVTPPQAWGDQLKQFRKGRGLSQSQFAELIRATAATWGLNVGCDSRHVIRWENGGIQMPTADYLDVLHEIGAPLPAQPCTPELTGGHAPAPLRDTSFLEALATAAVGSSAALGPWMPALDTPAPIPDNVGMADVAALQAITRSLRGLDQRHGGHAVRESAVALLRSSHGLLAGCHGPAKTAMMVAVADLARLAGWASHDIGDQARARAYCAKAFALAREAGAESLAASTLYVVGRISLFENDPAAALRVFQLGQMSAQMGMNRAESARLYTNEAWAHAMLGSERGMRDALARAQEELSRVDDADVDPWTEVFFSAGEFAGNLSVIFNGLAVATDDSALSERYTIASADRASASLAASTHLRPARSVLFDHITVATARFRLGDVDGAKTAANAALEMTGEVRSARATDRLQSMVKDAASCLRKPGVRELCRRVKRAARAA